MDLFIYPSVLNKFPLLLLGAFSQKTEPWMSVIFHVVVKYGLNI